ncbi:MULTISPECIES: chromosome segregation protein SMC [unclassified Synechocystis]|uniref:chromosome segregation protein SMC n=1 Tax=unclassified Synechocystis TaxID=2640012 RepID=UPI00041EAB3D|nr:MULTISPECIES: chromosome segregation protein SMC [unclassified Synechocystis]AIE74946.1 Chromosome partition protein smc [Synechocystis sp. PCC 6714]MCT0253342.1 chromosome segregation protein SMC [Synechocystis sp. CS-94]
MVYVKRIELSHFKSFGGTTAIPFLPGFTVVSGPNGSGKSNILDALLFCLGLATSKGMRAERLPDLVNNTFKGNRGSSEASVSVTFELNDGLEQLEKSERTPTDGENGQNGNRAKISKEWTVTRRLKVTKGGSYSSNYYINGEQATVAELHEQLNELRIYPEGYNIVLQGDVTRIITMNSKERREIIDELAGVAEFDRKIVKTKETLGEVQDREERCQIIATELERSLERLAADRQKAEKYQALRQQVQEKQSWEKVIQYKAIVQQRQKLCQQLEQNQQQSSQIDQALGQRNRAIQTQQMELEKLNAQVKALGEEEQLAVAAQLATQKAQREQLQQRYNDGDRQITDHQQQVGKIQGEISQSQQQFLQIQQEQSFHNTQTLPQLEAAVQGSQQQLEQLRHQSQAIASASEAWVQEQTKLSRTVNQLQDELTPQRSQRAQLEERQQQLIQSLADLTPLLAKVSTELQEKQISQNHFRMQGETLTAQIQTLASDLAQLEQERSLLQETQTRLLKEQQEKQRQLDKLEAASQAQQEVQGTYATKVILQSDLPGVCGLVAQLGQVEPRYQLALEIAAGGRLGFLVVEDDGVAAAGIEILKQAKAGRATFLPLNKIRSPKTQNPNLSYANGYIDLAVNLIDGDRRYAEIFAFVFGNTLVFDTLANARAHLGKHRLVTLDGDLLEASGAMSGGSRNQRSGLRFGTMVNEDTTEVKQLRQRLHDIQQVQGRNEELLLERSVRSKQLTQQLMEMRQQQREVQLHGEQTERDIVRLSQQQTEINQQKINQQQKLQELEENLALLQQSLPPLEQQLTLAQQQLTALETSQTHQQWQTIQSQIRTVEAEHQAQLQVLRQGEDHLKDLHNSSQRLEEKIAQAQEKIAQHQAQDRTLAQEQAQLKIALAEMDSAIQTTEAQLAKLSEKLGTTKQARDRLEQQLTQLRNQQQEQQWQWEKLQTNQRQCQENLGQLEHQLGQLEQDLPDPLPEIPLLQDRDEGSLDFGNILDELQRSIRNGQKRLEAMEPVNMLALEEYQKTEARLGELSEKLQTIAGERTELLLRVENFTTLRRRSFQDAFDAVNKNFQIIFAELSDGDGYLQLDDPEDPFNGGLNLVAHPKGKPVRRLSSMSGGEKSLTALSFIFALQRYRPSPFYGFDEVDMFLDGANVEKLSKMVRKQAQQAQFIVVSLRRPMIEAAERTIGVTQARGAHTQVLGIKL